MVFYSCCKVLTLQVGVTVVSYLFFIIPVFTIFINGFDYQNDPKESFPVPIVLMVVFTVLMVGAGIVLLKGAFDESRKLCLAALAITLLLFIFWLVLCCFSFGNSARYLRKVCNYDRCPESFWFTNLRYRGHWRKSQEGEEGGNEAGSTSSKDYDYKAGDYYDEATIMPDYRSGDVIIPDIPAAHWYQMGDHSDVHEPKYKFGAALVAAIVLFVVNLLFFIVGLLVMWSYSSELKSIYKALHRPATQH